MLDDARHLLARTFGYDDFRPPQRRAVQAVLSGRDALIVLPTGGGKSLCFQVPALMRSGLTVVVSPLISLMKDQVDALARREVAATYLNSTLTPGESSRRLAAIDRGEIKLLYVAPERLRSPITRDRLARAGVTMLAVDEAHCISEWGHDFRPSYRLLGALRDALGAPQTVALTATATPSVREDIVEQLALRDAMVIVGGFDRTNLTWFVEPVSTQASRDRAAARWLRDATGSTVVYAPTRNAVERVAQLLNRAGVPALGYHAGLDTSVRQRTQDDFMNERVRTIVATSAFGMGIDKPDVRLVLHYAMPGTLESYYQEAGRAGRDGQPSRCILLHNYPDRFTHEHFIDTAHPERALIEHAWNTLVRHADREGLVSWSAEELAQRFPNAADARKVDAVLRIFAREQLATVEPPSSGRVFVRLLATPERIRTELDGDRDFDREVLRALWRAVGKRLEIGASVDLDGLPPGLGGAVGLVPVLERLASEQFVDLVPSGGGIRLRPEPRRNALREIDWRLLERRRRADMDRLDAVQRYAQTRACRRAFVLRYFGDPDAKQRCAACDRCLGIDLSSSERPRSTRRATRRS
jgi:ATP-dependent DNA helicase RecQ